MTGTSSRPTIHTVASAAGVSVATVSQVLNERTGSTIRVGATTRERVLQAVDRLGYQANSAARNMRRGRTDVICLVLQHLSDPWSSSLADRVHELVAPAGYTTSILLDDDWDTYLSRQGADGALIDSPRPQDADRLAALAARGVAIVVYGEKIEPAGFDVVRPVDTRARAALINLLTGRHRRIACLSSGGVDTPKVRAYERGLRRAGIAVDPELVVDVGVSAASAYDTAKQLLAGRRAPTAFYCTSDLVAANVVRAAHRLGVAVPDDIEVVGSGNNPETATFDPPITTIGGADVHTDMARLLLARLQGDGTKSGELRRVEWRLHRRGTTRPD